MGSKLLRNDVGLNSRPRLRRPLRLSTSCERSSQLLESGQTYGPKLCLLVPLPARCVKRVRSSTARGSQRSQMLKRVRASQLCVSRTSLTNRLRPKDCNNFRGLHKSRRQACRSLVVRLRAKSLSTQTEIPAEGSYIVPAHPKSASVNSRRR